MRWTRRSNRKALKALALSFAASASFAGNATAAQVHDGGNNVQQTTAMQATFVGVSRPDGYQPQLVASVREVSSPDGYQPQLRGTEQILIRETPDGYQPQTKGTDVVSISADSSRFEVGDLALGFGLGLILATAGAIALAMSRGRERAAHT